MSVVTPPQVRSSAKVGFVWLDGRKNCRLLTHFCSSLAIIFGLPFSSSLQCNGFHLAELDLPKSFPYSGVRMSFQGSDNAQNEDGEEFVSDGIQPSQSTWKSAWQDNKGMFLILLSEIAGSSMDAIVRFLQQGERRMHPFQVCPHRKSKSRPVPPNVY
jgi:hypothetical protein